MSYSRRRHRQPRYQPAAGWFDAVTDLLGGGSGSDEACGRARADAQRDLDQRTARLLASWKPTGYYRVEDLARMRDQTLAILAHASKAIDQAASDATTYKPVLRMAGDYVTTQMGRSMPYTNAVNEARARGVRVIDAPSFKRWVIDSMNKAAIAYGQIAYQSCIKPKIITYVAWAAQAWDVAVQIAAAMVRATIAVGEEVIKVSTWLLDMLPYAKWAGLGYLAYVLTRKKKPPEAA